MNPKIKIVKVIAIILMFIGFGIAGVLSHEAGHLSVNNYLGGTGSIFYNYTWTEGHMNWATLPPNHIWLVYLGGGICAAVFLFLFFWLAAWLTPSKQDVYIETAVGANILTNLCYAPTEIILYRYGAQLFQWAWITAYILATILFFIIYIKKIIKWLIWPAKLNP